jgi:co-chaperonin GroES (HSP10)
MLKPTFCNIVFEAVDAPNVSKGGILAPESYRTGNGPDATTVKAAKRAKVLAVGPGKTTPQGFREPCCKPGDYVQLASNAFIQDFMLNGTHTYVTQDDYVVGILDETDVVSQAVAPVATPEKRIVTPALS